MLILAAVPDIQLLNLRRAAAARFTLARAGSWAEALSTIRTRPVELAVVDPLLSGEPRTHEIERLRVLYAHRLLQDPGFTIEDVAQRLGYAQAKTLQQHARSYLGLTAGEMRLSLSPQEALEQLTRRFLKPQRSRQVIAS